MQVDDLFTLFILVVAGLSLLGRKKRPPPRPRPARDLELEASPGELLEGTSASGPPAPGSLGELFRQIQLEQRRRAGIAPRQTRVSLPSAEDVEDRETLEIVPVVYEREPVVREPPVIVDLDETGQEAISRRLKDAAARNRALTAADHRAFDQRVRASLPPTASQVKRVRRSPIQNALIWKEILGRPVSLRDGDPLDY